PVVARKRFADEEGAGRLGRIVCREKPALTERDLHGGEVIGIDHRDVGGQSLTNGKRGAAINCETGARKHTLQREKRVYTRRTNAGERTNPGQSLFKEGYLLFGLPVFGTRKRHAGGENLLGIETGIDGLEVGETADQ